MMAMVSAMAGRASAMDITRRGSRLRGRVGAIALARVRRQIGLLGGGQANQRGDVVGQDLGGHVDEHGLLRQARDGFELEPLLEPFERLLNAPALVIEICEQLWRECLTVQVGGQRAQLDLMANEQGVGVNQSGSLAARSRGITLDLAGNLTTAGSVQTSLGGAVTLSAPAIALNNAALVSDGLALLQSGDAQALLNRTVSGSDVLLSAGAPAIQHQRQQPGR